MGIIEALQKEVLQLRAEVDKLKGNTYILGVDFARVSVSEEIKAELSQQEIRNNIIQKAKDDIENLKSSDWGCYRIHSYYCDAEFITNKEKRTVVCLLKGRMSENIRSKGIAKCEPYDCFNSDIGASIALHRALGLDVPSEYYTAPNPTEVTKGDIVTWRHGDNYTVLRKEDNYYNLKNTKTNETFFGLNYADKHIVKLITDDSRDGVKHFKYTMKDDINGS